MYMYLYWSGVHFGFHGGLVLFKCSQLWLTMYFNILKDGNQMSLQNEPEPDAKFTAKQVKSFVLCDTSQ